MDSSRFHILCQDEFLGFEQNDENGENFLGKREKERCADAQIERRSSIMGFKSDIEIAQEAKPQDIREIAKKLGLKADTVEEGVNSLVEKIKQLNESLNIPKSFKDAGIDEKEFLAKVDILADRAFEDQCTTANPRVPLVSEIKQILLDSYYGK